MIERSVNVEALRVCRRISSWGADPRSRIALFAVAVLSSLDNTRRAVLRAGLRAVLHAQSVTGILTIRVELPHGRGDTSLRLRLDDTADYQSLVECLGEMYPAPRAEIRYVLDGGANIGLFTIAAQALQTLQESVLAEPSPLNLPLLCHNVRDLPGCRIHKVALAGQAGAMAFEIAGSNSGHLTPAKLERREGIVQVSTCCIGDLLPQHWEPQHTWIKLDIEGAEYDVIPDLLRRGFLPAALSAEVHDYLRLDGSGLVDHLENHGYRVAVEGRGNVGYVCRQISAVHEIARA